MKMAKKLLALVLTGVMAMSVLTGCGSTASRQAAGKLEGMLEGMLKSRVPIKQYLQKFPKWGRFGVTSVTPFLLLPVHPEGCTPAHRT